MYITFFAGSPCENTVSFLRNLQTSLPRPAESRKPWALKACFPLSFIGDLVLFELAIACITSPLNACARATARRRSGRSLFAKLEAGLRPRVPIRRLRRASPAREESQLKEKDVPMRWRLRLVRQLPRCRPRRPSCRPSRGWRRWSSGRRLSLRASRGIAPADPACWADRTVLLEFPRRRSGPRRGLSWRAGHRRRRAEPSRPYPGQFPREREYSPWHSQVFSRFLRLHRVDCQPRL